MVVVVVVVAVAVVVGLVVGSCYLLLDVHGDFFRFFVLCGVRCWLWVFFSWGVFCISGYLGM